jgi:hypothetical protein
MYDFSIRVGINHDPNCFNVFGLSISLDFPLKNHFLPQITPQKPIFKKKYKNILNSNLPIGKFIMYRKLNNIYMTKFLCIDIIHYVLRNLRNVDYCNDHYNTI